MAITTPRAQSPSRLQRSAHQRSGVRITAWLSRSAWRPCGLYGDYKHRKDLCAAGLIEGMDFSSFLKSLPSSDGAVPSDGGMRMQDPLAAVSGPGQSSEHITPYLLEHRLAGGASKGASDALAAAAGRSASSGATGHLPRGRPLNSSASHLTVELQALLPESGLAQLEGTTITHYATEPSDTLRKLVAVNASFITYGLQKGHIRVLHKQTGMRALLKDHDALVTDLRFLEEPENILASVDANGRIVFRQLTFEAGEVTATVKLSLLLISNSGSLSNVRISCQPSWPDVVAAAAGPAVLLIPFSSHLEGSTERQTVSLDELPHGFPILFQDHSGPIQSLAVSPAAGRLAVGTADGKVKVASTVDGQYGRIEAEASAGGNISSIVWLSPTALLIGSQGNTELHIWHLHGESGFQHQQTVVLKSTQSFLNSLAFEPQHGLVMLSNVRGNTIAVLHLSLARDSFDALLQFKVTMPILSMEAYASTEDNAASTIQVFTLQTQAIQQYSLQPEECLPAGHFQPELEQIAPPNSTQNLGIDTKSASHENGLGHQGPSHEAMQDVAASIPMPSSNFGASELPPVSNFTPLAVIPPQPAAPPQPQLLTPSQIVHAAKSALPRSISGAIEKVPSCIQNSSVVETEAGARPSPSPLSRFFPVLASPSRPIGQTSLTSLQPPEPQRSTSSNLPQSLPKTDSPTVFGTAKAESSTQSASGHPARGASASSSVSPSAILTRDSSRSPQIGIPAAAQIGIPADVLLPSEQAGGAQETPASPRTEGPPPVASSSKNPSATSPSAGTLEAVRQALQGIGEGEPSQALKSPEQSINSFSDLYERLARDNRKQQQQQNQNHQALMRALREEVRRESKRLEIATDAQLVKLSKAQLRTISEERKALIAEERQNLEKLLVAISGSINRDLPNRIEEILKREVAVVVGQARSSIANALSEALPRELGSSNIQAPLEKALASQLKSSLAKPLQDALRQSFQHQVLPAFEGACQSMFSQVQATFAGGLAEHLQAAGGANAAITTSLQESLVQANAVAAKLAEDVSSGYQQLLQLSSQHMQSRPGQDGLQLALVADHKIEMSRLLEDRRYDDAFSKALDLGDLGLVSWLCTQVEPQALLGSSPPLLSQHVMLVLLQQLGFDLSKETSVKVRWMKDLAVELDPQDPMLRPHARSVLQSALSNIQHHNFESKDIKAARFASAVLESALQSCQPNS